MGAQCHLALQWRHHEHDSLSNHQPHDCSDADQRKHQSSASLAFVRGIHRSPVNSPHRWPVTRKMSSFDDVIVWLAIFWVMAMLAPDPALSRKLILWRVFFLIHGNAMRTISEKLYSLHGYKLALTLQDPQHNHTVVSQETNLYMMTSSNGNIFRVTGHLCGEFTGPQWIPHTKASDAELLCYFDLHPNKRLSKQLWGWWFETQSRPLWRHRNVFPWYQPRGKCISEFSTHITRNETLSIFLCQIFLWTSRSKRNPICCGKR